MGCVQFDRRHGPFISCHVLLPRCISLLGTHLGSIFFLRFSVTCGRMSLFCVQIVRLTVFFVLCWWDFWGTPKSWDLDERCISSNTPPESLNQRKPSKNLQPRKMNLSPETRRDRSKRKAAQFSNHF